MFPEFEVGQKVFCAVPKNEKRDNHHKIRHKNSPERIAINLLSANAYVC